MGLLFGIMIGLAKVNNIHWCDTNLNKRIIRIILANFLLIPSWIFEIYYYDILKAIGDNFISFNAFSLKAFHAILIYFLIFGISPYYIFYKCDLTNKEKAYVIINAG